MLTGRRCISRGLVLHRPFALQSAHAALQDWLTCRSPRSAASWPEHNLQRGLGRRGMPYGIIKALEVFVQAHLLFDVIAFLFCISITLKWLTFCTARTATRCLSAAGSFVMGRSRSRPIEI